MKTIIFVISVVAVFFGLVTFAGITSAQSIPVPANHSTVLVGPASVPAGATLARFVFSKPDKLKKDEIVAVVLERSLNGGMPPWEPAGGGRFNSANPPKDFVVGLPEPSNSARMLRAWVTRPDGFKGQIAVEME